VNYRFVVPNNALCPQVLNGEESAETESVRRNHWATVRESGRGSESLNIAARRNAARGTMNRAARGRTAGVEIDARTQLADSLARRKSFDVRAGNDSCAGILFFGPSFRCFGDGFERSPALSADSMKLPNCRILFGLRSPF
jgi:hypothetical protein